MTLTVRLPDHIEEELAKYCVKRRITKSQAVKQALDEMLRPAGDDGRSSHPFIGGDQGVGSDVSGTIKTALRVRFAGRARSGSPSTKAGT